MTDQSETTRRRRPDARPGEIIDAALTLFSERGFSATRLADVASRAGLSKAAIYLYFKDKTSLLKAVVEATAGANLAMAGTIVSQHEGAVGPLLEKLIIAIAGRMNQSRLPDLVKLVISESRAHPEIGRFYLENVIGKALPLFTSLIQRGIATGEFRAVDPALTVKCMIAPMLLAAMWRSVFEPLGAPPLDIDALARQHCDLIRRALAP